MNNRPTYDEAAAKVRSNGYVRIEDHTATNMEQLDELYNVIFVNKDKGTYSEVKGFDQALAEAKKAKAAEESGAAVVVAPATPEFKIPFVSKAVLAKLAEMGLDSVQVLATAEDEDLLGIEGVDDKVLAKIRKVAPKAE